MEASMWFSLFFATLCVQQSSATCNKDVLQKIKALRLKNKNILHQLHGEYKFVYISAEEATEGMINHCIKIKFWVDKDDYKMRFLRIPDENWILTLDEGAIKHTEQVAKKVHGGANEKVKEVPKVMRSYVIAGSAELVALYMCSEFEPETEFAFIAVPAKAKNMYIYDDEAKKAAETMKSVGLKAGSFTNACN